MLFRYKVKKTKEHPFDNIVIHYKIIIQSYNYKKSKWVKFKTVDLKDMLQIHSSDFAFMWTHEYLVYCVDVMDSLGGFDNALKKYIKKVIKDIDELSMQETKEQAAIDQFDKLITKDWNTIEISRGDIYD